MLPPLPNHAFLIACASMSQPVTHLRLTAYWDAMAMWHDDCPMMTLPLVLHHEAI